MKRRWFFGSVISAALLLVGSPAKAADALLFERHGKSVVVRGNPADVVSFMYRYQDALWPSWRSHERTVANHARHERRVRRIGTVEVYVGCDITRKAFTAAIR